MSRKQEFFQSMLPETMYHGAEEHERDSISSNGLLGGHITPDVSHASQYGNPDIWEIKKHPGIVPADGEPYGDGWTEDDEVYWAKKVPPTHVKRVAHVIRHFDANGYEVNQEVHWHKREECPDNFDYVFPVNAQGGHSNMATRPHPTNPSFKVGDY